MLHLIVHPLPDFDMGQHAPPKIGLAGPKTEGIGLKGPWHLNPGNPNFPNHRPYLGGITHQAPTPAVAGQTLKFPGGT